MSKKSDTLPDMTEYSLYGFKAFIQKIKDCFRILRNKQYILIEVKMEIENRNKPEEVSVALKASRYRLTQEAMFVCMNQISHEIYDQMKHEQSIQELIRNIDGKTPNMN